MTRLAGTRALVTGASSGIGRATAIALAGAGCRVLLAGQDTHRLDDVARAVGGGTVIADLADRAQTLALGRALAQGQDSPQLVVHNAGVGLAAAADETGEQDVDRLLAVNLVAPILLTGALLPAMLREGRGHLVFVTSIAGELGVAGESAYAASKGGLGAYAASLRGELAGSGIRVTTVVPGVVDTAYYERRGMPYGRGSPRAIPAEQVAAALVRAVERDRTRTVVPPWLRLPIAVRALAPETYARLASRWG